MFYKIGVFKYSAKFTGKYLRWSLRPDSCDFIKIDTPTQVLYCEFFKIFKNTFFQRTPPLAASEILQYN